MSENPQKATDSVPDAEPPPDKTDPGSLEQSLESLYAEAIELQQDRKKQSHQGEIDDPASDRSELDSRIAQAFGSGEQTVSDDDPDLGLPDLPDLPDEEPGEGIQTEAPEPGVSPAVVQSLQAEIETLKAQKKNLHEQMSQNDAEYTTATRRVKTLEAQVIAAARQSASTARDFESYRNRTERERQQQQALAGEKILKAFLGVYDNLLRALEHSDSREGPLGQGVAMTLDQFLAVLKQNGVEPLACEVGSPFDPTYHEAIRQDFSDEIPKGRIISHLQTGFVLGDRLLRAARVSVSQGPEQGQDEGPATGKKRAKAAKAKSKKAKDASKPATEKKGSAKPTTSTAKGKKGSGTKSKRGSKGGNKRKKN
ncbi:MAG: nucleotide exchange factor GrpE [Myxococcota bacterium]|nr:nucleotide exchange factor GrpE [Myxococcota bacterium]